MQKTLHPRYRLHLILASSGIWMAGVIAFYLILGGWQLFAPTYFLRMLPYMISAFGAGTSVTLGILFKVIRWETEPEAQIDESVKWEKFTEAQARVGTAYVPFVDTAYQHTAQTTTSTTDYLHDAEMAADLHVNKQSSGNVITTELNAG